MSDHLSSTRALADPASDICDLYAFPAPGRPGRLVLVLTVHPLVQPGTRFCDSLRYRFRLRPLTVAGAAFVPGPPGAELVFDCTVAATDGAVQSVRCETYDHHRVETVVDDRAGAAGDGLRLYAGRAADPFIFQLESIAETLATGRMMFGRVAANTMAGADVLGLVLELDVARWLRGGTLFGVVAETLAAGPRPVRLERVGRPEIKNIGLQWNGNDTVNRDIDLRDLYNQEDAFAVRPEYLNAYRTRLDANLRFYDGLDGRVSWPETAAGRHPLTDLLLADHLVVDASRPFAERSWFEIERELLAGRPPRTAGGRALNDDFLDRYYTLLVNGGDGPAVDDGVDRADRPATDAFPYLAEPYALLPV
ncbi:DUF4331 family protein [Kitasatospora sp. NPDC002040]|uniref:DUF4331 family protein n=1 Tax=Kitasatospora sp. NPDC002040 TaxID=3154661 RepID=UPI00331C7514